MIQPDNNDQMRGRGALRFRNLAIAAVALAVLFTASTSHRARADDPDFLRLAVGFYDINDNQEAVEVRAEYQSDFKLWFVKPFIGIMGTTDAAVYGYGGLLTDIYFGRRWVLTPSLAVGGYRNGDGKDLGHVIEFRSSIELAYRFDNRSRLGLSLYHLSNASLSEDNQGTEILSLSYSIPLGWGASN